MSGVRAAPGVEPPETTSTASPAAFAASRQARIFVRAGP
jgi:hypothetical protein